MVRGRGKLTPQEIELMNVISANINRYLTEQNKKTNRFIKGDGYSAEYINWICKRNIIADSW